MCFCVKKKAVNPIISLKARIFMFVNLVLWDICCHFVFAVQVYYFYS
jgi:hypothetical protein